MTIDPRSPEFADCISPDADLVVIGSGYRFVEGPVWLPAGAPRGSVPLPPGPTLLFSDIPADRIYAWAPGMPAPVIWREPSNNANGNTTDPAGNLLTCEHATRRVTRTDPAGNIAVLAEFDSGRRFNSPNDLILTPDAAVLFSDPTYGLAKRAPELPARCVWRIDPAGSTTIAAGDGATNEPPFEQPNGLCLSPDAKFLYVADSGKPRHIRRFAWNGRRVTDAGPVFCNIDTHVPDGIRCDAAGRLWSSAGDGVHVFDTSGKLLGKIRVPETVSNLTFGGPDGTTLYMTATTRVYAIRTSVTGA